MIPLLSRAQIRELDRHAIEQCGVPSLVLMENAGRGAAEIIERELVPRSSGGRVVVVCGPGNNGGDGFVVARRLRLRGFEVGVWLTRPADKLKGDARANCDAWLGLGGKLQELGDDLAPLEQAVTGAALIVDALFGTGLDRPVDGRNKTVIDCLNRRRCPLLALDVPSGIDADSGGVLGAAVRADMTVTFAEHKRGLFTTSGALYAGRIHVVDIGVPALVDVVGKSAELLEAADVAARLVPRSIAAHKSAAGRVLALAGSAGKTGAALLVARGAFRAGAGLVTLGGFAESADALDRRVLEEMTARIDRARIEASLDALLEGVDAVAIGPGLGLGPDERKIVDHVVLGYDGPKVVDADALTHFAGRATELARAAGQLVLTPHPGEAARLLEVSASDVERDRFAAASRLSERCRAVVLLKGPRTLIAAPGELPAVQRTDAPALATAGAGDVLTGVATAFACGLGARWAACCAAYVHGRAAERWTERVGADRGLLAHEVADEVPHVLAELGIVPR